MTSPPYRQAQTTAAPNKADPSGASRGRPRAEGRDDKFAGWPCLSPLGSRFDDQIDCGREAAPVGGFLFELGAAGRGQRIKFGLTARFGFFPLGFDPGFLFQAMQSRVERALLDLQNFTGNLLNALGDGPTVLGLGRNGFEDQEIQSSLDQVVWFSHAMTIYTRNCR